MKNSKSSDQISREPDSDYNRVLEGVWKWFPWRMSRMVPVISKRTARMSVTSPFKPICKTSISAAFRGKKVPTNFLRNQRRGKQLWQTPHNSYSDQRYLVWTHSNSFPTNGKSVRITKISVLFAWVPKQFTMDVTRRVFRPSWVALCVPWPRVSVG